MVRGVPDRGETTATRHVVDDGLDDQLLRSQLELTWSLARLALELKSEQGVRASSDIARAMEAALEKAERYSRQTPKAGLALTHLNALKQAIAGMGLAVAKDCCDSVQEAPAPMLILPRPG